MFGLDFYNWNTYFGLIGLLAFGFSIWQFYKTKSETKITLYKQELIPIISDSLKIFKDLQIKVIEKDISVNEDVYHFRFFIKNTGNIDISAKNVHEKIKVHFSKDLQILDKNILAYPNNIYEKTDFDIDKNELTTEFQLLKKGELIKYDLIIHIAEHVKKKYCLTDFYKVQKFIFENISTSERIENCKQIEYLSIRKDSPKKTYLYNIGSLIFITLIMSGMYLFMSNPIRVIKKEYFTIKYNGKEYIGRIEFKSGDSIRITDAQNNNKKIEMSNLEFNNGNGHVEIYKTKKMTFTYFLMIFGWISLASYLTIYQEIKKAKRKNSILYFIKRLEN